MKNRISICKKKYNEQFKTENKKNWINKKNASVHWTKILF